MEKPRLQMPFFFGLLLGVGALTIFIFLPYLLTLSIAATIAVLLQPIYRKLSSLLRGMNGLAAMLTIIALLLLVFVPLTFIGVQVVQQATALYAHVTEGSGDLPRQFMDFIEGTLRGLLPGVDISLNRYAGQALNWIAGSVGPLFAGTIHTILHLFLGLIALYYMLKDGGRFIRAVISLSPLADHHDQVIVQRLEIAINSIVRGSLLVALIQGISSGIGLQIFGVPSAALWGSMAALGALIPGVGTATVLAPAILYLFFSGHTIASLGLLIWSVVAVGLVDNFLGPILVGRGIRVHPVFILFSVIGGINFFGPLGFIVGPLVLSLLFALLDIYKHLQLKGDQAVAV